MGIGPGARSATGRERVGSRAGWLVAIALAGTCAMSACSSAASDPIPPAFTGSPGSAGPSGGSGGSGPSVAGASNPPALGATGAVTGGDRSAFPDATPRVARGAVAVGPDQAPLVDAILAYETVLVTGLHTGAAPGNTGAVVSGTAMTDLLGAIATWSGKGWSLRGTMTVGVRQASVTGEAATVAGCLTDDTAAFTAAGPVETPRTRYTTYAATLSKQSGGWVVSQWSTTSQGRCA